MAKRKTAVPSLRDELLAPLAGFRHRRMEVSEGRAVVVREPGADDWLSWNEHIRSVAGEDAEEENADAVAERIEEKNDHRAEAAMLVRVLLAPDTLERVFSDDDAEEVAQLWGPVYNRFLNASFELAGLTTRTPVEDAEKN